ncbi:MAG: polysaccharide biosynthesis tyrosine autokinase, partial [Candidatus Competibacteraceae bacterium]
MSKPTSLIHEGDNQPEPRRPLVERVATPLGPARPLEIAAEAESEDDAIDLRALWRVILKRRWTILAFTLIVVTAVVTATYLTTPIYRASLTLQIDTEDLKVVQIEEVSPATAGGRSWDYYQTQYALLKSRSLALRVVNDLGLTNPPPESPPALDQNPSGSTDPSSESPSTLSQIRRWLTDWWPRADAANPEPRPEAARIEGIISGFLGGLTVEPVRDSRLVRLHYDSPDPKLAAAALNTLAKNYIELNLERRFEASSYARNFLQERLQQVKTRLEDSERELIQFAREQEIVQVDNQQNIVNQTLTTTNQALAEAERRRIAAEAVYRQMLSTKGQGLSQVLENGMIQTLKGTKAQLETQYQENLTIYKPAYPAMVQLRNQIGQVNSMINQEIGNIREAITANYEAARTEEALLRSSLEQTKGDVLELQDRSIQLNILRREVDTNRQLYDGLLQRFKEVGVAAGIGTNNISIVDEAKAPAGPYKPNLRRNALLALMLGLLGGVGLAFLFEHLDDTFHQPEDLEKLLGVPVLGIIPRIRDKDRPRGDDRPIALIGLDDLRSAFAEAYRSVRTALQFSTAKGVPRLLTVTSAMSGEGKSTTILSLAIQFAQAGKKTLLVEADLRKPSIHRFLQLDNQVGLTNYLAGEDLRPVDIAKPTSIPNLFVITSGPLPPNPAELLASARMVGLLALAAEKFDQVVVDSPPLLGLADSLIIGNFCEGTLFAVEMGSTPRGYVQGAFKRLRGARVP